MKSAAETRAAWLAQLHSTEPADRPRAEAAVRRLYAAARFPEPKHVLWFDSPCAASWPVAVLAAEGNRVWSPLLAPSALSRDDKHKPDRARSELTGRLGSADWKASVAAVGAPRLGALQLMPDPSRLFSSAFLDARYSIVDDISALFTIPGDDDDLARSESHFRGGNHGALTSAIHCATAGSFIGRSFFEDYSFSSMADDEQRVGDGQPPAILGAAWEIGRSVGLFWPFENAAFLCERPAELHFNDRHLLHRTDGPAAAYRDGWRVYAWNGKAVPERWITDPEAVPPRDYKGFDPTFAKWVKSKGQPAEPTKQRAKPGSILKADLPSDPAARLERLRAHAGGKLPRFDRYQAGEHRQVWRELVSLGAAVREDAHAADALAVAYETMRRVDQNVRTVVQRLTAIGYVFTSDGPPSGPTTLAMGPGGNRIDLNDVMRNAGQSGALGGLSKLAGLFSAIMTARDTTASHAPTSKPDTRGSTSRAHVPPGPNARKEVADFEQEFGTLPLSLRAFYEVVGEVNLTGTHAAIDPPGNSVAPDPLLVYGLDEGIVEFDEDDEDGEAPRAVTIAPDDLHKANTSGGDPYEMAIPDPRVDGKLLNERHNLFFVDYLRLCFEYGGFPGYDGQGAVPAELDSLKAGLVHF